MRIVGGELRGRALAGPRSDAIRPTSDRLRETLFDILIHRFGVPAEATRVLDLFAGTGALGLEALSRGAASVLFVDESAEARGLIRTNIEALAATGRARLYRRDATRLGPIGTLAPFDLLFADPPYGRSLGEASLSAAIQGGWLLPDALCVLEESADVKVMTPPGLTLVDERHVRDSQLLFFRFGSEGGT